MTAASPGGFGQGRDEAGPLGARCPGASALLVNAHERIVLGTAAEEAVVVEAGRCRARRVFIIELAW